LIAISGVVLGIITFKKEITSVELPLIFFLFLLGGFGAVFSAKQYERYCFHRERARGYRAAIDELFAGAPLATINKLADKKSKQAFPILFDFPLHTFWFWLYIVICILAILLAILAQFYPIHGN
jgi:hypothetical protein